MGQRQAVTKTIATRYRRAGEADKGKILEELCATTGWHRNHARKALGQALGPHVVRARRARPPTYGPEVLVALTFCWAVLGAPTGKRLAPVLGDLVVRCAGFPSWRSMTSLRRCWWRCRRQPSTGGWRQLERRWCYVGAATPSPGRCSRMRSRAGRGRSGTTRCPASWRSTWSATRAATPWVSIATGDAGSRTAARSASRPRIEEPRDLVSWQGPRGSPEARATSRPTVTPFRPVTPSRPPADSRTRRG